MKIARRARLLFSLVLLVAAATAAAQPATEGQAPPAINLSLQDATAEEAAAALSKALGVPVSVAPGKAATARVALNLVDVTPLEALTAVATALHGRSQPIYSVAPAGPDTVTGPPFATGRRVTLKLENAGSSAALTTVVVADGGVLEGALPDAPRITIRLEDAAVEEAMDRVTAALGLTWRRAFRLLPGVVPTAPAPRAESAPDAPRGPGSAPSPSPAAEKLFPLAEPVGPGEPGADRSPMTAKRRDLARALADGLARVMQTDPRQRRAAVRDFAQQVERGLRDLSALPPEEQSYHRAQIARVYQSGMRLYRGLTPDQQQEFRPLFDVLRRWLGL